MTFKNKDIFYAVATFRLNRFVPLGELHAHFGMVKLAAVGTAIHYICEDEVSYRFIRNLWPNIVSGNGRGSINAPAIILEENYKEGNPFEIFNTDMLPEGRG